MILYHFTADHFVPKIKARGLVKGRLPWNFDKHGNPQMLPGYQWLTTNPDYLQPWCLLGNLPYSRNAVRITVEVPKTHEERVFNWLALCRARNPDCAEAINSTGGDVENWRVYGGPIPPFWFVAIEHNLNVRLTPENLTG
jgi:hypothetical protein